MFPPIAAFSEPQSAAGFVCQFAHGCAGKALMGGACQHGFDPRRVGVGLIAQRCKAGDPLAQGGFGGIKRTGFDSVVEPLEAHVRLGGALVQLGDVLAAALGAFLTAVQQ
ncbi:hypothetical protein [Paracoccus aerodenitrificans]|uniref:hypothetical protein n=1 Tax=Paracoccus aerodenitrificans TaxID=3017781 RepID=UPI0022F0334E|nr:hypothetical protein [Paracoccus aerodenitrificans]WBU65244.1 hypothetical protein PAE61_07420 [Paracoccus aerodenitrificans]